MKNYRHIYVYKTDKAVATYEDEVRKVMQVFKDRLIWNTDLEDRDKILKIKTDSVKSKEILNAMTAAGFYCEELI